ncbi:hypothetical protein GGR58DRAFT_99095 [Xylaria digitata]|nr:hypothetical protein GGR58DRAFT_99095 [Xylaria digitata]
MDCSWSAVDCRRNVFKGRRLLETWQIGWMECLIVHTAGPMRDEEVGWAETETEDSSIRSVQRQDAGMLGSWDAGVGSWSCRMYTHTSRIWALSCQLGVGCRNAQLLWRNM